MNYRHAYHAGNFADVLKHVVVVGLIESLLRKATPFAYLDSHAGSARYALQGEEAETTREYTGGILKLLHLTHLPAMVHVYLNVVRAFNAHGSGLHIYPGSPLIAASLMRPQDRLTLCELHPEEARSLKQEFAGDERVACHQRNGYEALKALLPPKERRGLVLIDPPFEAQLEEYDHILAALGEAYRRWPTGIYAVWFPIKLRQDADAFYRRARELPFARVLAAELCLHPAETALRLNGCGMLLVNPPYRFEHSLAECLPALGQALQQSRYGSQHLRWLRNEPA